MKQKKSVLNRKTIKSNNYKVGTFTSVPYSILHNPNLSPTAKLLIIQILSDNDSFTLSPSLYAKRLGVTVKTIYNALDELEEKGYIRRTPIGDDVYIAGVKKKNSKKIIYHYLVSEFGNLNKDADNTTPTEEAISGATTNATTPTETSEVVPIDGDKKENNLTKMSNYLNSLGDFSEYNENDINDIILKYVVDNQLTSYYEPKNEIEKLITKEKKRIYKECMEVTSKIDKHTSKKAITEFSNWLKDLIFEKNDLKFDHSNIWLKKKAKHRVFKTDHETMMRDLAEQRYYDGDSD